MSRHTQTKKRKRKRTQNREDPKEVNSDEAGTDSPPADEEPSSPQTEASEVTLREDRETHTTPSETSILDLTSFEQGTKPRRRGKRYPKGRETPTS